MDEDFVGYWSGYTCRCYVCKKHKMESEMSSVLVFYFAFGDAAPFRGFLSRLQPKPSAALARSMAVRVGPLLNFDVWMNE